MTSGPVWPCPFSGLEKAMAPHSSTLAWRIPWMEEPGRLQSMGPLGVGHNWATSLSLSTFMHWRRKWHPTRVLAWRIPGMREPGGLPSMGSHRVRHDWSNLAAAAAFSVSRTENLMCLSYSSRAHLQGLIGVKVKVKSLTRVQLFGIPWTVAHQVPPSMGFSRQYWSGLPFPSPGESSRPRDWTQVSHIAGRRFNLWATREDLNRGSQ